jgi:alpha-glucosidase
MKTLHSILLSLIIFSPIYAKEYILHSIDKNIAIRIKINDAITINAEYKGSKAIKLLTPDILIKDVINEYKFRDVIFLSNSNNDTAYFYKKKYVRNIYNGMNITFNNGKEFELRVYNEGFAYRFKSNIKDTIYVLNERMVMQPKDSSMFYVPYMVPRSGPDYMSSFESIYDKCYFNQIDTNKLIILPLLYKTKDNIKVLFTESDLFDYAGLFLKSDQKGNLNAIQAPYPKELEQDNWSLKVTSRKDFIARTYGERNYPWRVFVITDDDKELLNNDMVFKLARKCEIDDLSWIKPGKAVWDWWHNNSLYGVNFKSGLNTLTYKHYIDFASEYGIEYINIDEGWYYKDNMLVLNDSINLKELIEYAESRNVKIFLWCKWFNLAQDIDNIMKHFSSMGIAGFKIDFIKRNDQLVVNFMEKTLITAAKYKMLINFHGVFAPTGLQRTYPNEISREGVVGAEYWKFADNKLFPNYDVTMPFIRMVAGHLDCTPGGLRNLQPEEFHYSFNFPSTIGTRCHELAKYIVFESPLQMISDIPKAYRDDKNTINFISAVPTTWDETLVIEAELGEYLIIARKKDSKWYIGGICADSSVTFEIPEYILNSINKLTVYSDGKNSDRIAIDYNHTHFDKKNIPDKFTMNRNGGIAIICE